MEDNPYATLLNEIRKQAAGQIPITIRFGKVISPSPLKVDVSNTIQEADDLLKNEAIKEFHSGDSVLLIPFDEDQKFIILCKVVGV